jgi:hypothetical protein
VPLDGSQFDEANRLILRREREWTLVEQRNVLVAKMLIEKEVVDRHALTALLAAQRV